MNTHTQNLRLMIYASLFAALIAVGAFISIPIGPVPIVLQNLFILLAGLVLGRKWGFASVAIYLLAGAIGLPVFAGGTGGIGKFIGPTGGYLISYLPAVFLVGLMAEVNARKFADNKTLLFLFDIIALVLASLLVYAVGVSWLKVLTKMSWEKAFTLGMLPFILGDCLKIAVAAVTAKTLRQIIGVNIQDGQSGKTDTEHAA